MLADAVAGQDFEAVAGRDAEIVEAFCCFDTADHDEGAFADVGRDSPG